MLRPHGLRGPCEHATPVFRLADTASFVVAATPRCDLCALCVSLSRTSKPGLLVSYKFPELSLIHYFHPQLTRLLQFASRIFTDKKVIRFFADAAGHPSAIPTY